MPFRLLSGRAQQATELTALGPDGQISRWTEHYQWPSVDSLVTRRSMPSGAGYLRIKQWPSSDRIDELIDEAFEEVDRIVPMGRLPHGAWEAELLSTADSGW